MYKRFALAALALGMIAGAALAAPPAGFEIIEAAADVGYSRGPGMNDCGALVYVVRRPEEFEGIEVFRCDNGFSERVTFSDGIGADLADINDAGAIVWNTDEYPKVDRLFLMADEERLGLGPGSGADINDLGHVAWKLLPPHGTCVAEADIFLYDGEEVHQLTSNSLSNQAVELNDFDDLAWVRYDFCRSPWTSHILMHTGGRSVQLTDRDFDPQEVRINNAGRVAWGSTEGLDIWENGETYRLFDGDDQFPNALNNLGQIVIGNWDPDQHSYHIWLFSNWPEEPTLERITDDANTINAQAVMNDWGEVAWMRRDTNTNVRSIRYLRRIRTGDSEFDGDVDHDDLAKLVDCMTGPMWVERTNPGPEDSLCECRFLDINHDGSVDLRDYARFQQNFGGE